jgi:hypothetical protein
MADDIVSELAELQRQASALQGLLATAQASAPRRAEGSDATGTLWATIDGDGLPSALSVQDGWQRRVSPERFGPAVVEAFAAASTNRMTAWDQALSENGWTSTVDTVRRELDGPASTTAPLPAPPPVGRPRPAGELLNDMLTAFEQIDDASAVVEGSGTSGYHKLELRLAATGLVSCEVDAQWASHQSGNDMAAAFGEALVKAKADLAAKSATPSHLDQVLGEALALLNDPHRLAES